MIRPLIVSLALDDESFRFLTALRKQHFPPERYLVDAHVTLFHALPGELEGSVRDDVERECAATAPFDVRLPRPRLLGRGVAVEVESATLVALRGRLRRAWDASLTAQDRQGYRPHVTIQNKVSGDQARATFDALTGAWDAGRRARALGLQLWRYAGGPWEPVAETAFAGAPG